MDQNKLPGEKEATTSMILGIISAATWLFGWTAVISVALGIIGLVFASKAKELGYNDNKRTAGFVLSIIGLCGGGLTLISCVSCIGCANSATIGGVSFLSKIYNV